MPPISSFITPLKAKRTQFSLQKRFISLEKSTFGFSSHFRADCSHFSVSWVIFGQSVVIFLKASSHPSKHAHLSYRNGSIWTTMTISQFSLLTNGEDYQKVL